MGWEAVVGTRAWFMKRFTIRETKEVYVKGGRKIRKTVVTGYQNLEELRSLIEPWFIRRTAEEPEVAKHLPAVQSVVLHPEMPALQARTYKALQKGTLKLMDGEWRSSMTKIKGPWIRMLGAADGTRTLDPEMVDSSGKSDWLMEALTEGDLQTGKVLVFSRFARSVYPLMQRLDAAGIEYGRFMGSGHQSDAERQADVQRFKTDPDCRVLLATSAVERGLNLQVARAVVFYGIVPNPARLEQVMGRIRRGGSPHATVYALTLLSKNTVEEPLWEKVLRRNAVKDFIWEEESVLFEKLGPEELAEMIAA
jgi:SNF2 family DNA or RNA helicase